MTARRTIATISAGLVLVALPSTALAGGRPQGMSPGAYNALVAQGQALNARYGNAVTKLSPQQFIELYNAGGSKLSPEALNALLVRSQAMNKAASETSLPRITTSTSSTGSFAWGEFGIGVAATIGMILLLGGIGVAVRTGRRTGVATRVG